MSGERGLNLAEGICGSPAEAGELSRIETALAAHPAVSGAAALCRGEGGKGPIFSAYVSLREGVEPTEPLLLSLVEHVGREAGFALGPEAVRFVGALPKLRSGKIARSVLKKVEAGEVGDLGDASALEDSGVIADLLADKGKLFGD